MESTGNIVIGDESAVHFLLHSDAASRIFGNEAWDSPLADCVGGSEALGAFNLDHPLYGGRPVALLVPRREMRLSNARIDCRLACGEYPARSFFKLREGLYIAAPEFTFLRMASEMPMTRLAELGVNLCGRYYLSGSENSIASRRAFLTTPERLDAYARAAEGARGAAKARAAVRFVAGNSASPEETHTWLQFCMPVRHGGFGLAFTHMNYDVRAGRLARITEQSAFSIDIAAPQLKFGIEYDGGAYHQDSSSDKRRRNELRALGWEVFPLDAGILYRPDATVRLAEQVARCMGRRLRLSEKWEHRFIQLRQAIGLPV